MGTPAGKGRVEMPEVFADDAVLVRRIHIVAEALELVEKITAVERVKLRKEGGQHPQFLEPPMEFTKCREAGQFLAGRTAHGPC